MTPQIYLVTLRLTSTSRNSKLLLINWHKYFLTNNVIYSNPSATEAIFLQNEYFWLRLWLLLSVGTCRKGQMTDMQGHKRWKAEPRSASSSHWNILWLSDEPQHNCLSSVDEQLRRPLDQTPVTASLLLARCPFDVFKQFIFVIISKGWRARGTHSQPRGPLTQPRCIPYSILSLLVFD